MHNSMYMYKVNASNEMLFLKSKQQFSLHVCFLMQFVTEAHVHLTNTLTTLYLQYIAFYLNNWYMLIAIVHPVLCYKVRRRTRL